MTSGGRWIHTISSLFTYNVYGVAVIQLQVSLAGIVAIE